MNFKNTIISMLMTVMTVGIGWGQLPSSFPPKSYPASILVVTDPGVKQYWDVKRIMYLGPGNGGHKFRIYGTANADHRAASVDMHYIRLDDKLQSAGAFYFPEVKKDEAFNFDIVSAYPGYAPSSFLGFMIKDDLYKASDDAQAVPYNVQESLGVTQIQTVGGGNEDRRAGNPDEIRASEVLACYDAEKETGYQPATFPGGKQAMLNWFGARLKYLPDRYKKNLPCKAKIRLRIDKDGSVWLAVVDCGENKELARWIRNDLEKMPNWIPAKSNGEPISSSVEFPINIK